MTFADANAAVDEAPVMVHVTRGGFVESAHRASMAVTSASGSIRLARGAIDAPILPRSTLKPIQALAMVGLGLDLPAPLLALVCSSHSGEPRHLEGVEQILATAGLTVSDLQGTPALPLGASAQRRWLVDGKAEAPIAQDCSGKHAGMLVTAALNGWPTTGYLDPEHPLQIAIAATVAQECGPISHTTVDGCGAPLFSVTLAGLAAAFGRLAGGEDGPRRRIADAMRAAPEMVGGQGRDVSAFMEAVPGLIAKDGAESVYAAGTSDGDGVAIKVADGGQDPRARQVLLAATLQALGLAGDRLERLAEVPVLGHGRPVGVVSARPIEIETGP